MTARTVDPIARTTFHELVVADIDLLCDDAAAITFDVPAALSAVFAFSPGQFVTLRRVVGGIEHRRSYSICAARGAPLRVGVREIPGGLFSGWLVHQLSVGDRVEVQAPSGRFVADPDAGGRHLCIGAGSGITPLLSVATSMLVDPRARVTLIYGNRATRSVMFTDELADTKSRYGARFDLVHVLSREPRDVELFSGRLDADRLRRLLTALVPLDAVDHVWLCGPFAMVAGARVVLAELGVPEQRVHVELFHVDEPPPVVLRCEPVVDGATSSVTLVLDGRSTTSLMSRDQTVLAAAQADRADLPYACRGGVCGTCRARVTEGEVVMRRNYALDPADVERGFVLTCQSLPVSEVVAIDFDS